MHPGTLSSASHSSWRQLLADPGAGAHIMHIYDDDAFHAEAVAWFAAEGLRRGERVLLTPTRAHWKGIAAALAAERFEVAALQSEGRLVLSEAETTLTHIMDGPLPSSAKVRALVADALGHAPAGGPRLRWWGEMTHLLHASGNVAGALRQEVLCGELAREHGMPLFCSFCMDRFDAGCYGGALTDLCAVHTHLVPAADYALHRRAVNRAVEEVIGPISGLLLQSLASWRGTTCDMPSSQALLFWVRDTMPDRLPEVLACARRAEAALG